MTDLAAKIESALGEHMLYEDERNSECKCGLVEPEEVVEENDPWATEGWFAAHIADVIAPLVEAHGREAAAAALEAAARDFGPAQISGLFHGADGYTKAWLRDRAAQHRSKP